MTDTKARPHRSALNMPCDPRRRSAGKRTPQFWDPCNNLHPEWESPDRRGFFVSLLWPIASNPIPLLRWMHLAAQLSILVLTGLVTNQTLHPHGEPTQLKDLYLWSLLCLPLSFLVRFLCFWVEMILTWAFKVDAWLNAEDCSGRIHDPDVQKPGNLVKSKSPL